MVTSFSLRLGAILFAIFFVLLIAQPTAAHGYVIRSIPEDRATLERSPARLQYWFSEALEPDFSSIHLRDQEGNVLASGGVSEEDNSLLVLRLPDALPDGAYVVELRPAFASDGHVLVETRVFFIGEEVGGVEGQAADDTARPLEVVWKTLLFSATYLLFGTAVLYSNVLVPVWGSEKYPRGLLPPRVMRRLTLLMWGALLVAAYANVMALLQQRTIFFGVSLDLALEGGLWEVVRIGSRFGDVWNFRMLGLLIVGILLGAAQYFGGQYPRTVRSFWVATTWLVGLLLGAQAINSHAAGSLIMPWVAMAIHWLHVTAVAFWIGGIAALALVLPVALAPYDDSARWEALRPLMRRFSRYVTGALLVVITSGIYSASNWFFSPADFATTYGTALATKLAMIALLLAVAVLHHVALRPQLLGRFPFKGLANWAKRFGLSLRVETAFAVVTITLAALLSATPIPEPEFLQREVQTPNATKTIEDTTVQVAITPGGTGINTMDIVVNQDGESADDLTVEVQFVAPELGERSRWELAEPAENGLYVLATDRIDKLGHWWTLIDLTDSAGSRTRAAFEWNIS
ncbi:MAG: CopD family protein, partial [Anaerolineae bacterium]|nr:CopD family protein [Anaerolineae bacterium]